MPVVVPNTVDVASSAAALRELSWAKQAFDYTTRERLEVRRGGVARIEGHMASTSGTEQAGEAGGHRNSRHGTSTRREHILALAARLFAEKGIAATSVRDIGDAAGILSGSLYYHFDSKESIVKEIISGYLRQLLDSYEETLQRHEGARDRFEGLVRASFDAISNQRHACEIFQNDTKALHGFDDFPEFDEMTSSVQGIWMETIRSGVEEGVFRNDVPARVFYRFARDMVWFTVRWYQPAGPHTLETLASNCISVLLDGFAVPAD